MIFKSNTDSIFYRVIDPDDHPFVWSETSLMGSLDLEAHIVGRLLGEIEFIDVVGNHQSLELIVLNSILVVAELNPPLVADLADVQGP